MVSLVIYRQACTVCSTKGKTYLACIFSTVCSQLQTYSSTFCNERNSMLNSLTYDTFSKCFSLRNHVINVGYVCFERLVLVSFHLEVGFVFSHKTGFKAIKMRFKGFKYKKMPSRYMRQSRRLMSPIALSMRS